MVCTSESCFIQILVFKVLPTSSRNDQVKKRRLCESWTFSTCLCINIICLEQYISAPKIQKKYLSLHSRNGQRFSGAPVPTVKGGWDAASSANVVCLLLCFCSLLVSLGFCMCSFFFSFVPCCCKLAHKLIMCSSPHSFNLYLKNRNFLDNSETRNSSIHKIRQ